MSEYKPDEIMLRSLKQLELTSQNTTLGMPYPGSELFKVIGVSEWKIRMIVELSNEISQAACSAYTREWMKGKE